MKIMVLDVPATESGALSILQQFHREVKNSKNMQDEWFFIVSTPELSEFNNIKVINYPWIKKSWFHRLYFDKFVIRKIVKELNIDCVISLQNTIIQGIGIPQILYLHQPLPFVNKRYKLFDNPKFWIYQNIISKAIIKSAQKAKYVIVQTEWLKDSLIDLGINGDKIIKNYPQVDFIDEFELDDRFESKKFIYPATPLSYKNHIAIVEACKRLEAKGIKEYEVLFTMNETDNKLAYTLKREVEDNKLNIQFIGRQSKKDLVKLYRKCTLLFPSYIETFGLPMLEARMCSGIVLASDTAFCREVLDGYQNAYFFEDSNYDQLSDLMQNVMEEKILRHDVKFEKMQNINLYDLAKDLIGESYD